MLMREVGSSRDVRARPARVLTRRRVRRRLSGSWPGSPGPVRRGGTAASVVVRCGAGLAESAAPVADLIEQLGRGDHLETGADRAQRHGGPVR